MLGPSARFWGSRSSELSERRPGPLLARVGLAVRTPDVEVSPCIVFGRVIPSELTDLRAIPLLTRFGLRGTLGDPSVAPSFD